MTNVNILQMDPKVPSFAQHLLTTDHEITHIGWMQNKIPWHWGKLEKKSGP